MSDNVTTTINKIKNRISRAKWLIGGFAGIFVIISNDVYKDDVAGKRMIIALSIVSVAVLAFSIVKFEKVISDLQQKLDEGEGKVKDVLPSDFKWPQKAENLYLLGTLYLGLTGVFLLYVTLGTCLLIWIVVSLAFLFMLYHLIAGKQQ